MDLESTYSQVPRGIEEEVHYVEVPLVQEVIKRVPKKEIVKIEKKVPEYVYQYVDKIVEVPQVQYVDKVVEVPQIQEVVQTVPKPEIIEVPREVIKKVPKIETKVVEQIVEVAGEVIEVPRKFLVENKVVIPKYKTKELPTVVAQTLIPHISESETEVIEIVLNEYVPKIITVDVYVPKPVNRQLVAQSQTTRHEIVDVPPAQWNSLVKNANPHITSEDELRKWLASVQGQYPISHGAGTHIVPPEDEAWNENRDPDSVNKVRWSHEAPYYVPTNTDRIVTERQFIRQQVKKEDDGYQVHSTEGRNKQYSMHSPVSSPNRYHSPQHHRYHPKKVPPQTPEPVYNMEHVSNDRHSQERYAYPEHHRQHLHKYPSGAHVTYVSPGYSNYESPPSHTYDRYAHAQQAGAWGPDPSAHPTEWVTRDISPHWR